MNMSPAAKWIVLVGLSDGKSFRPTLVIIWYPFLDSLVVLTDKAGIGNAIGDTTVTYYWGFMGDVWG